MKTLKMKRKRMLRSMSLIKKKWRNLSQVIPKRKMVKKIKVQIQELKRSMQRMWKAKQKVKKAMQKIRKSRQKIRKSTFRLKRKAERRAEDSVIEIQI